MIIEQRMYHVQVVSCGSILEQSGVTKEYSIQPTVKASLSSMLRVS